MGEGPLAEGVWQGARGGGGGRRARSGDTKILMARIYTSHGLVGG